MKKYESLKKVELHCHLDGSLNPTKVAKWTKKSVNEVEKHLILQNKGDLTKYLECFDYSINLLQSKNRLKEAAEQLCTDLLADSVVYAEIRFDPLSHVNRNLTLNEAIAAVLEGIKNTSLKAKVILCMKRERSLGDNKTVIDVAKKHLKRGICAVDLAGDESKYPTKSFKELFDYAKSAGVPVVIHAGEAGTYKDIDAAISFGAMRIGHGVKAITSFETMEKLKKNDIPLEVCISSNIDTGIYTKFQEHPVQRLIDSGVSVIISTDNRTLSNTTLTDEYNILNKTFGLNIKDFNEMNKNAVRHSFLTDKEKTELLKEFE